MKAEPDKRIEPVRLVINHGDEIPPLPAASSGAAMATAASPAKARAESFIAGEPQDRGGGTAPPPASGDELPSDAPVKPLGTRDGSFAYLNPLGEFRELTAGRHNRLELEGLFASQIDFLERDFARMSVPRKGGASHVLGIEWDRVSKACMNSCARRGVFDDQHLRGRGAWRGDQGELVYHAGDRLFRGDQELSPGVIGGFIYARGATLPHPWPTATPGGELGPASKLLKIIRTWAWSDTTLEPQIVLGWACIAMVGGAAAWRPMLAITGSHGSGKSHLLDLLDHFFAGAALFVSDSSAAGLSQWIRHQTLPVMVDEFENAADSRRAQEVLAIVRQAASGGRRVRGGADHQGVDFTLRSAFAYAGINLPIMSAADRSRVAVVELAALPSGAAPPLVPRTLRELGRQILRRMIDSWPRYEETLGVYRGALLAAGLTARSADLYAALLSGADLALHDGAPDSDFVDEIVQRLKPRVELEHADAQRDEQACLAHLLSALLPPDGPGKRAVAELVATVCNPDVYVDGRTEAGQLLERHGIKVRHTQLAIANRHAQLVRLFAGTCWGGRADTTNGWVQSLRRVPGGEALEHVRFAGVKSRATGIPLSDVLPS
ncbi:MAG: hypothetical protein ACREFI_03575, partial [Stellaceae bacterium]